MTVMPAVVWLPAMSVAVTLIELLPPARGMAETVQLVVPEAVPLPPVAELPHVMLKRPTASNAEPLSETGLELA